MKFVIFLLIIVSGLLSAHAQSEPTANTATDTTSVNELMEVVVVANPVTKVRNSAFNATAINTSDLVNTTRTLSETLNSAPGMKIRESGGVGSDMAVTMDGFSGRHVKVFIDGVPQEGVGNSFGLNNIPVNFANRIEVYRGVVPVGFGSDAIGGVINVVTNRRQRHRQASRLDLLHPHRRLRRHLHPHPVAAGRPAGRLPPPDRLLHLDSAPPPKAPSRPTIIRG